MALEGGAIRYGYIESNGTVALATNPAASNLVLRVNGIIYLEG